MEETDVGGLAYKLPELYIPRGSIYCCVFISILGYMETRGSSPSRMAVYKIQLVDGSPGRFHVDRQKQWKFTSTSIYVLYLLIRATVFSPSGEFVEASNSFHGSFYEVSTSTLKEVRPGR